jgi:beta-glucanase (GH16 family)
VKSCRPALSVLAAGVLVALSFAAGPASPATAAGKPVRPGSGDACGTGVLKPDGSPWSCTFADDFGGKTLNRTKWIPQTAFVTGDANAFACYLDDPSTVKVSGGSLNLTVRRVATPVSCRTAAGISPSNYVSGMVSTYHLFSQQYGRFEARIRNTATSFPGLHEAFWLWPDDRVASTAVWPASGEIDVSETYSVHPDLSFPFLHYSADAGGQQPGLNTAWDCAARRGDWNTYRLEWSPTRIEILVNGRSCLVNTSGDAAFQKPYIVAFTQALGSHDNAYDGRAPLPATMSIDYLRVWK